MQPPEETQGDFDAAIVGGALSGAACALLLKRRDPSLRVVVIEKSPAFKRRVGEATTEVSGWFLLRMLGLGRFLVREQIPKNGLRFWFSNDKTQSLADCSEIGGCQLSSVPAFLVDRSTLDEEVLRLAAEVGAEILRPAQATSIELREGGLQRLTVESGGSTREIRARWVVDASGVKAMLARANGWLETNDAHPTLAAWSRWRGTGDWDSPAHAGESPDWTSGFNGIRSTATNHFAGDGWWAWWIQLRNGDTSIGAVLDQRHADWLGSGGPVGEKLRTFLSRHPAARDMMRGAEFVSGDVHFRRNLPYFSTRHAGDGFVLVGDASAFIDPLYSPGMDWIAFTTSAAVELILQWRAGTAVPPLAERHNRHFTASQRRMFEALYRDKYEYLGDHDLMRAAIRMDIASYYAFVVRPLYKKGPAALDPPPLAAPEAVPFFLLMRFIHRRLAALARSRRARGTFGKNNHARRDLLPGFTFSRRRLAKTWFHGLLLWLALEVREGWKKASPSHAEAVSESPATELPLPRSA